MPSRRPPFLSLLTFAGLQTWLYRSCTAVVGFVSFAAEPGLTASPANDFQLQVGIVQRFGSEPTDQITLQALPGDRLTLQFPSKKTTETLQVREVQLEIVMQPLPEPEVNEQVVLSTHRSFESAEHSAEQWQDRGIPVEIAQPGNWEVWAERATYRTPLLRRLLLQSLRAQEFKTAFVDTEVLQQIPRAAWVTQGYRYHRDELWVSAGTEVILVAGQPYVGSLRLQPNAYGTYTLVNRVPLEEYLRGVVPYEIWPDAPQAAVEAQAILARTYALRNLRRFAIDDYELCADTQCQVYKGLAGATALTDRAIAATRGEVLTYEGELVDAVYSSTTGGITAPFHDVWNGAQRPYLKAVVDAVDNVWDLSRRSLAKEENFRAFIGQQQGFNEVGWQMFRWQVNSSLATLNQELKTYLTKNQSPLANFQTIQDITVVGRSPAGRVLKVAVTTDQGTITLEKDEILRVFSAPRSTLFYVKLLPAAEQKPDQEKVQGFAFVGGGLGHGVGLSQTGSYRLAEIGWSRERILNFYYPGTQIQQLNESVIFWRENNTDPVKQPQQALNGNTRP